MKISARNQWAGRIGSLEEEGGHCRVTVLTDSGTEIQAHISSSGRRRLKLETGSAVVAMVKAAAVVVATDLAPMVLSAENCLHGTISKVERGAVNNVLTLDIGGGNSLCATVTLYSSETLALEPGKAATAVFNADQVMLGVLL